MAQVTLITVFKVSLWLRFWTSWRKMCRTCTSIARNRLVSFHIQYLIRKVRTMYWSKRTFGPKEKRAQNTNYW